MIKDLSYNLHLHESGNYKLLYAPDDPSRPQPIQHIKAAFINFHRLMTWTLLSKRGDIACDTTMMSHDGSGHIRKVRKWTACHDCCMLLFSTPFHAVFFGLRGQSVVMLLLTRL